MDVLIGEKIKKPYFRYLLVVSTLGVVILLVGLIRLPTFASFDIFALILGLAIAVQLSTSSVTTGESTIVYHVAPAIAAATIPFYGPFAGALVVAAATLSLWALKPVDGKRWKKTGEQLIFNMSNGVLAVFCAGVVLVWLQGWIGIDSLWGWTVPWVLAAAVNDQVSLWLVLGIMRLSQGKSINILDLWLENRWAMIISILIFSLGGGILTLAIYRFGWIGGTVFFLPIALSSLAYRIYVRQMEAHLANLEELVNNRTAELQALMREKDAFLAVLTHDMKTPLASIGLYADTLMRRPQALVRKPEIAQTIKRSQVMLLDIVNNILDLEKMQAGIPIQLEPSTFEINKLVRETVDTIHPMAEVKDIDLTLNQQAPPLNFSGDRDQLGRVIGNLLTNAIKYTPDHGKIIISMDYDEKAVRLVFEDNGYGIPEQELPYIFDRYHRVKIHERKSSGTGLGLAISKALVEAHGGEIRVSSSLGAGSVFVVNLPLRPAAVSD